MPVPVGAPGLGPGSLPPGPEPQRGEDPAALVPRERGLLGASRMPRGPPLAQVLPIAPSRGLGRSRGSGIGAVLTHSPGTAPSSGHHREAGASGSAVRLPQTRQPRPRVTAPSCVFLSLVHTRAVAHCAVHGGLTRIWGRRSGWQSRPRKGLCEQASRWDGQGRG